MENLLSAKAGAGIVNKEDKMIKIIIDDAGHFNHDCSCDCKRLK